VRTSTQDVDRSDRAERTRRHSGSSSEATGAYRKNSSNQRRNVEKDRQRSEKRSPAGKTNEMYGRKR